MHVQPEAVTTEGWGNYSQRKRNGLVKDIRFRRLNHHQVLYLGNRFSLLGDCRTLLEITLFSIRIEFTD